MKANIFKRKKSKKKMWKLFRIERNSFKNEDN